MNASHNSPFRGLGGGGIFIIGFMGSGKSYWGRIWATAHGLDFYDLDGMIEVNENRSVTEIFKEKGENYFRERENAMLKCFHEKDNFLLACGGGTPCFYDNMQWMNDTGITVYLSAFPEYLSEKLSAEIHTRPLLMDCKPGELNLFIEKKLRAREFFYKQANFILPVTECNEHSLAFLNP